MTHVFALEAMRTAAARHRDQRRPRRARRGRAARAAARRRARRLVRRRRRDRSGRHRQAGLRPRLRRARRGQRHCGRRPGRGRAARRGARRPRRPLLGRVARHVRRGVGPRVAQPSRTTAASTPTCTSWRPCSPPTTSPATRSCWTGPAGVTTRVVHELGRRHAFGLPEHFTADWEPVPDYHRDDPAHPFRPYGVTVGHLLEWSRLTLLLGRALGPDSPTWLLPRRAVALRPRRGRRVERGRAPGLLLHDRLRGPPRRHPPHALGGRRGDRRGLGPRTRTPATRRTPSGATSGWTWPCGASPTLRAVRGGTRSTSGTGPRRWSGRASPTSTTPTRPSSRLCCRRPPPTSQACERLSCSRSQQHQPHECLDHAPGRASHGAPRRRRPAGGPGWTGRPGRTGRPAPRATWERRRRGAGIVGMARDGDQPGSPEMTTIGVGAVRYARFIPHRAIWP